MCTRRPEPAVARSISAATLLLQLLRRAAADDDVGVDLGVLEPVEGDAWVNPREITRSRRGKLGAETSVEVMCQRTKAPAPPFQPLHRQELPALATRRDAT
jgi:hypothetical protein